MVARRSCLSVCSDYRFRNPPESIEIQPPACNERSAARLKLRAMKRVAHDVTGYPACVRHRAKVHLDHRVRFMESRASNISYRESLIDNNAAHCPMHRVGTREEQPWPSISSQS